ncbi:MAG: hypothetical protein ACRBBN_19495 [Methyloligellaceae bacterium]
MFRTIFLSMASLFILLATSLTSSIAGMPRMEPNTDQNSLIVNVHNARQVHDRLHRDEYLGVRHIDTKYDDHDKPVYIFKACKHGHRYIIDVDWYGDIIKRRNIGDCHRHHRRHRYYERDY